MQIFCSGQSVLPKTLDEKVTRLHLTKLGAELTEQRKSRLSVRSRKVRTSRITTATDPLFCKAPQTTESFAWSSRSYMISIALSAGRAQSFRINFMMKDCGVQRSANNREAYRRRNEAGSRVLLNF